MFDTQPIKRGRKQLAVCPYCKLPRQRDEQPAPLLEDARIAAARQEERDKILVQIINLPAFTVEPKTPNTLFDA